VEVYAVWQTADDRHGLALLVWGELMKSPTGEPGEEGDKSAACGGAGYLRGPPGQLSMPVTKFDRRIGWWRDLL
jgi:hypothetical protein